MVCLSIYPTSIHLTSTCLSLDLFFRSNIISQWRWWSKPLRSTSMRPRIISQWTNPPNIPLNRPCWKMEGTYPFMAKQKPEEKGTYQCLAMTGAVNISAKSLSEGSLQDLGQNLHSRTFLRFLQACDLTLFKDLIGHSEDLFTRTSGN